MAENFQRLSKQKFDRTKNFWRKNKPEIILIPLLFLLDRLSKIWALKELRPAGDIKILPFFHLTYVENTGAAFGSFHNANAWLAGVCALVLCLFVKWRRDISPLDNYARYGILLIIGGALGNLYDRIILGFVVDYFNFMVWPVFNAADSFISAGAALLGFAFLRDSVLKRKEKK
jgi:signal peptidase II